MTPSMTTSQRPNTACNAPRCSPPSVPTTSNYRSLGLFHDVGHILVPGDDAGHGEHGANYLRPLFGARVAEFVALHVPAKRWLVTVEDAYGDGLSEVSQRTLIAQGGAMTVDERTAFENHPCFADAVTLRRADEAAKVPGKPAGTLADWIPQLRALAGRH